MQSWHDPADDLRGELRPLRPFAPRILAGQGRNVNLFRRIREAGMDKYQCEVFGEFTYSQSLTYEELIATEGILLERLEEIFWDAGAEHLDFTPLGDILMSQCAFTAQNLEILRDVAQEIAGLLPAGVRGRLLCLQKDLSSYHSFWIRTGEWREREYILPANPPEDAPVNEVPVQPDEDPVDLDEDF